MADDQSDKLRLIRGVRLPPEVQDTIKGLTKTFEPKDIDSIMRRAEGPFAKLERADTKEKK